MSSYLIHSRKFNRNLFRVLFDWFDFIHRCFFHSRWSCPLWAQTKRRYTTGWQRNQVLSQTPLIVRWIINVFLLIDFETIYLYGRSISQMECFFAFSYHNHIVIVTIPSITVIIEIDKQNGCWLLFMIFYPCDRVSLFLITLVGLYNDITKKTWAVLIVKPLIQSKQHNLLHYTILPRNSIYLWSSQNCAPIHTEMT